MAESVGCSDHSCAYKLIEPQTQSVAILRASMFCEAGRPNVSHIGSVYNSVETKKGLVSSHLTRGCVRRRRDKKIVRILHCFHYTAYM